MTGEAAVSEPKPHLPPVDLFFASDKFLWPAKDTLEKLETRLAFQKGRNADESPDVPTRKQLLEWVWDGEETRIELNSPDLKLEFQRCSESRRNFIAKHCRQFNNNLQTQQMSWIKMKSLSQSLEELAREKEICRIFATDWDNVVHDPSVKDIFCEPDLHKREGLIAALISHKTKGREDEVIRKEKELIAYLSSITRETTDRDSSLFTPGPVGDLPIHDCILLDLDNVGLKIIERFFNTPRLLSLPFTNDLDPWRQKLNSHDPDVTWEDGLYTGETVLHIAIVKEKVDLVKALLDRGINLSSRATGTFFQPKWIRPRVHELTSWQRFIAFVGGIDLEVEAFAAVEQQLNEYYG
jgi:hypothetical protein